MTSTTAAMDQSTTSTTTTATSTTTLQNRVPQATRGEGANLNPFSFSSPFHETLERHHKVTPNESPLIVSEGTIVQATWQTEEATIFQNEEGTFYITTERILFVSTSDANNNVAVNAACIPLFAVSENGLYIQVQETEDSTPIEFTIIPKQQQQDDDKCQVLFEALSKLVSMHPIALDDNDDDEDGDMMSDYAIFASSPVAEASQQERESMLDRLDNLLVVPPEYAQVKDDCTPLEGQFENAEEDDDNDAKLL